MAKVSHRAVIAADNHVIHGWEVANETARVALVPVAADLGRVCRQTNDGSLWACVGYAPAAWRRVDPSDVTDMTATPLNSSTLESMAAWIKTVNEGRHWGLQRTIPRKVHAKLWTNAYNRVVANGLKTQIRLMSFGDSLSGYKPPFVVNALFAGLSEPPPVQNYVAAGLTETNPVAGVPVGVSGTYVVDATGTFNAVAGDGFTYWPMYPLSRVVNTTRVKFVRGGVDPYFTNCVIYYVKEPGAGTMQVLVAGSVVATLDANATLGLGRYEITQAVAQAKVELLGTGGSVQVIGAFPTDSSITTVEQWVAGYGGIALSTSFASATSRALFQAWVTDVAPDIFMLELADAVAGWETGLNQVGVIIDAAIPIADKVWSAGPPALLDDYVAQRDIVEKVCRERGYIFFDGNTPLLPHSMMVSLGWDGDGVHPGDGAKSFVSNLLVRQLGLDQFAAGVSAIPLGAMTRPSVLGAGSSFRTPGGLAAGDLFLETTGQGQDWAIRVFRSLNVKVGASPVTTFQVGDEAQGFHTFLPSPTRINGITKGGIISDSGAPEGSIAGAKGFIYLNAGSAGESDGLWVKTTANSFAGWRKVPTFIRATGTLGTGTINAGTTATQNITVTGAVVGAEVAVGGPSTLEAGLILYGYVSATDTVTLRVSNVAAGSITPAGSQTVSVRVFNP